MKLYTRTGDDGTTSLFSGQRVSKDDLRVTAYGESDALNAAIGSGLVVCEDATLAGILELLQKSCFVLGADLATPPGASQAKRIQRIEASDVIELEQAIDAVDGQNAPLNNFVMPGGCELAARLHVARVEARRCERAMVSLLLVDSGAISTHAMQWINRCSDLLFAMARAANRLADVPDTPWTGA